MTCIQSWLPSFVACCTLLLTTFLPGCGSCPAVLEKRTDFDTRLEAEKRQGPHLRIEISTDTINDALNRQISKARARDLNLPGLGQVARYAGRYELKLRRLEVRFNKTKETALILHIGLRKGSDEILQFRMQAAAPIRLSKDKKKATLSFRADLFKRVEVVPSSGASDALAKHLRSLLPSSVRRFIPKRDVARIARGVISSLSKALYNEIRERILSPMGEIAKFQFRLPDVPIEEVAIVTVDNTLAFEVRTTWHAHGLSPLKRSKIKKGRMRLSLSADSLAELGNWGMYTGKIPNRYDMNGKPTVDGTFAAGLRWERSKKRPLKVHLWSTSEENLWGCMYLQAGARPRLSLKKQRLKVGFSNGKLETLVGPPLVNEVADILGISDQAFGYSKKLALRQKLSIGDQKFSINVRAVSLEASVLAFDLDLR